MPPYTPARGHIIWLDFDPQAEHEQAKRRPALVLSPGIYNKARELVVVCPITSQVKGYAFEVLLPVGLKVKGAVLADQIKNLDWNARNAIYSCRVPELILE